MYPCALIILDKISIFLSATREKLIKYLHAILNDCRSNVTVLLQLVTHKNDKFRILRNLKICVGFLFFIFLRLSLTNELCFTRNRFSNAKI